jgi:hypothetical protein
MGFTAADVRKDKKRAKKLGKKMNMSNPDGYSGTFRWARGTVSGASDSMYAPSERTHDSPRSSTEIPGPASPGAAAAA